jgi:hypothetical protein
MSTSRDGLGIVFFLCRWEFHPQSPTFSSITHNRSSQDEDHGAGGLASRSSNRSSVADNDRFLALIYELSSRAGTQMRAAGQKLLSRLKKRAEINVSMFFRSDE